MCAGDPRLGVPSSCRAEHGPRPSSSRNSLPPRDCPPLFCRGGCGMSSGGISPSSGGAAGSPGAGPVLRNVSQTFTKLLGVLAGTWANAPFVRGHSPGGTHRESGGLELCNPPPGSANLAANESVTRFPRLGGRDQNYVGWHKVGPIQRC